MFKIKSKQNKKSFRKPDSESGAIMLEVIAVLSLMALMGAALFRQIYLRNQELSNVQMASEIRVVKEAFAAWIQAHPELKSNNNYRERWYRVTNDMDALTEIATYLPLAYDELLCTYTTNAADEEVCNVSINYALFGRCDPLGPNDGYTRCVGLVVPYANTLPEDADWNFRRAAHVAMLIGADGGVFGKGMTNNEPLDTHVPGDYIIVGSLGSWTETLDADTSGLHPMTTYAATTGMDVFQPEIELAAVGVGLDKNADLALQRVHVYGAFTAGDKTDCYSEIKHTSSVPNDVGDYIIRSDNIESVSENCWPAFYVEDEDYTSGTETGRAKGNVRVANDLSVGYDFAGANAGKAAMRFDKNGMIVFEKATVEDPESSGTKFNYMLDPQYTSVMNDIKIMSRGGAKLSEILPKYLVKKVRMQKFQYGTPANGSHFEITKPDCPNGYRPAISVQPMSWNWSVDRYTGNFSANPPMTDTRGLITTGDIFQDVEVKVSDEAFYKVDGNAVLKPEAYAESDGKIVVKDGVFSLDYSKGNSFVVYTDVCVLINDAEYTPTSWDSSTEGFHESQTDESRWVVRVGYRDLGGLCMIPLGDYYVHALIQTYCVFDEEELKLTYGVRPGDCRARGWTWDEDTNQCYKMAPSGERTGKGYSATETGGRENLTADDCAKIKVSGTCLLMGCTWTGARNAGTCGLASP